MRFALALTLLATPALALETPSAGKNPDSHMCEVPYKANDLVGITAAAGDSLTVIFAKDEQIDYVNLSDREHVVYAQDGDHGNAMHLKAKIAMQAQPVTVRTRRPDGSSRDYAIQWSSADPLAPQPPAQVASNGPAITPVPVTTPCYVIRYTYAADDAAARAAAWRVAQAKKRQEQEEVSLHQQQIASRNYAYVAEGDASLAPTEVFDDGNTTELHFAGNIALPALYVVDRDGKESIPAGLTTEDGGVIKLHGTAALIRLRDGDRVLCLFNRRYSQVGNNPGTGTTSPDIVREVKPK